MSNLRTIEDFLTHIGFPKINQIGGSCPYQVEAFNRFGNQLYLRARGESASLHLSATDDIQFEWEDHPDPYVKIQAWEDMEAGFIGYQTDETIPYYVLYTLWSELKNQLD